MTLLHVDDDDDDDKKLTMPVPVAAQSRALIDLGR
jgi:hypothetical protein